MDPIRSSYEADPDMLEIVCEFARELPARVTKLEALLNGRAFAELQTLAHQLKGAGGGYGFAQITEVAGRLEHALKTGAPEPVIKDRAAELCATLRAVVVPETR
jgi:HPt (histidine-containing phosphotransfer) domain-containing protein